MSEETESTPASNLVEIDIGDGVKRELSYSLEQLEVVKKTYGSIGKLLGEEFVYSLPYLIHAGLVKRDITVAELKKRVHFRQVAELKLAVMAALYGMTVPELAEKIKTSEETPEKNEQTKTMEETGSNPSTSDTSGVSDTTLSA